MIFSFIRRLVFGTIKKLIIAAILIGGVFYYLFSDNLKNAGAWLISLAKNKVQIDVTALSTGKTYSLTIRAKDQIDAWLAAHDLNQYGDKAGTLYAGGSPLFDEKTGITKDRYDYLISKYPELKNVITQ